MKIYGENVEDNIPDGIHRCRIFSARKTKSKSRNDMLKIMLQVFGYGCSITHYITFIPEKPEIASRNLRELFESAPSISNNFDTSTWGGAECACLISHETYDGMKRSKVSRFVPVSAQYDLPHFNDDNRGKVVVDEAVCGEY